MSLAANTTALGCCCLIQDFGRAAIAVGFRQFGLKNSKRNYLSTIIQYRFKCGRSVLAYGRVTERHRAAVAPAAAVLLTRDGDMEFNRRGAARVEFERGIPAHMMAIDGTWRRACTMHDVSATGVKLTVEGTVEGLNLKEFFLLLSSTGLAYRRCELSWVNGDQLGATFLVAPIAKRQKPSRKVVADPA